MESLDEDDGSGHQRCQKSVTALSTCCAVVLAKQMLEEIADHIDDWLLRRLDAQSAKRLPEGAIEHHAIV
jgi:hypothetical protein